MPLRVLSMVPGQLTYSIRRRNYSPVGILSASSPEGATLTLYVVVYDGVH